MSSLEGDDDDNETDDESTGTASASAADPSHQATAAESRTSY